MPLAPKLLFIRLTKREAILFNSLVLQKRKDDCWLWIGPRCKGPSLIYGHFHIRDRSLKAHRVAYILENGKIPKGLYVLHSCDNPLCVNPSHLFLGTHSDNIKDCVMKGRWNRPRGENHPDATLTNRQHNKIITLGRTGRYRHHELATMFGVTRGRVSQILQKGELRCLSHV